MVWCGGVQGRSVGRQQWCGVLVFRECQWAGNTVWCDVVVFKEGQWAGNMVWCGGVQGMSVGR